ncbi:hypothetical protein B0I73DRAFT_131566 [Yarrowia lipolytica]|nr:hypothetical protein YALI1_A02037g [Yarrowia lipolytica]RDW25058.1 hypothetical protein B0I71DRAFT_133292 [Yarrowia lipolytica]RDW39705.1 hypothetical protein B0I73DRAFT_131566 [Yarrowia lipolytica]RDW45624.1 hypothetical protein B0I74DRAFT_138431 [Yarrowia lipolytica]
MADNQEMAETRETRNTTDTTMTRTRTTRTRTTRTGTTRTKKQTKTPKNPKPIGGKRTECTREDFEDEIKDRIVAQCSLKDVGIFYIVLCERKGPGWLSVCLQFYNDEEGVVHRSGVLGWWRRKPKTGATCFAIDQNTFLFDSTLLLLDANWETCSSRRFSAQTRLGMAHFLTKQTSVHSTGLSRIRNTAGSDFKLMSEEGETVEVHKAVLQGVWPFFRDMLRVKQENEPQHRIKLPMPKSTLDVLMSYLYGEELQMEFHDAANLILNARMYNLPELLELAKTKVKSEPMDFQQALLLWQKSFRAQDEQVRDHASARIQQLMPAVDDFKREIQHLEKDELVALFSDVSVAMAGKMRAE